MQRCRGRLSLIIKWQYGISKEQNPCIKTAKSGRMSLCGPILV